MMVNSLILGRLCFKTELESLDMTLDIDNDNRTAKREVVFPLTGDKWWTFDECDENDEHLPM